MTTQKIADRYLQDKELYERGELELSPDEVKLRRNVLRGFGEELERKERREMAMFREKRAARVRRNFIDLDTRGGNHTPELEKQYGWAPNQNEMKAHLSLQELFAASYDIPLEEAARRFGELRIDYAAKHFGKVAPKSDVEYWNAEKARVEHEERLEADFTGMVGAASVDALADVMKGRGPNWRWSAHQWQLGAVESLLAKERKPKEIDAIYQSIYEGAFGLMDRNPSLLKAAQMMAQKAGRGDLLRDDGAKGGRLGQGDEPELNPMQMKVARRAGMATAKRKKPETEDILDELAKVPEGELRTFFNLLPAYLKASGEEDVDGVVRTFASQLFGELADGYSTIAGDRKAVQNQMNWDARMLRELQEGRDVATTAEPGDAVGPDELVTEAQSIELGRDFEARPLTGQERNLAIEQLQRRVERGKFFFQVEAMMKEMKPLKAVTFLPEGAEMGLYQVANSAPMMARSVAASLVPYLGPLLAFVSSADAMRSYKFQELMVEHPDLDVGRASTVATISGLAQAVPEMVSVYGLRAGGSLLMRNAPNTAKAIAEVADARSAFWRPLLGRTGAGVLEEVATEAIQGGIDAMITNAILTDYPETDVAKVMLENMAPEVWWSSLFMRLPAAGVGRWSESRKVQEGMMDREMMLGLGLSQEVAAEVNSLAREGKFTSAETRMREEYGKLSVKRIEEGAKRFAERAGLAAEVRSEPAVHDETISFDGESWSIVRGDGEVVATGFESHDEAFEMSQKRAQHRMERLEMYQDGSVKAAIEWFQSWAKGVNIEDSTGELKLLSDVGAEALNREELAASMRRHGIEAGLDPKQLAILGENFDEIVDGVYRDTVRLYKGAHALTVFEEAGEMFLRRDLREGLVSEAEVKEWTKAWHEKTGFKLTNPESPTMAEATEATSQMLEAHFLGKRKEIPNAPKLFGLIKRLGAYLREAFGRAKQLIEMREAGTLSESAEGYLARALGLDEQAELNRATAEAVGQPIGMTASYSVGRLDENAGWRKVFNDDHRSQLRRNDARRAAEATRRAVESVRFGDDGTTLDQAIPREIAASIYGVELGVKPLYHDQYGPGSEALAEAIRGAVSSGVTVATKDGHLYVYREDAVSSIFAGDPEAYPGSSVFDRIHQASVGDYNGELLGFGARTMAEGNVLVSIRDGETGMPLTGFRAKSSVAADRARMFEKLWGDLEGKPVSVEVDGEKLGGSSFSVARADYVEAIAREMERATTEARVALAERVRRNLERLNKRRAEIDEKRAQGYLDHPNKETEARVAEATKEHKARVAEIERETTDKLASAATAQERNGVNLAAMSRKNASAKQLEAEIAKVTGTALERTKMLQALADYNAVLMALPPAVRGKLGGFVQLSRLKTDRAREKFFEKRAAKAAEAYEKHMRKEYDAALEKIFKQAKAKNKAGKRPVGKMDPEMHALFARLEEATGWDTARMEGEIVALEKREADGTLSEARESLLDLERAMMNLVVDWKNADSGRRGQAVKELKALLRTGLTEYRFKKEQEKTVRRGRRERFVAGAGGDGSEAARSGRRKRDSGIIGKRLAFLRAARLNLSSFEQVMFLTFGEGPEVKRMVDWEREVAFARQDADHAIADKVEGLMAELAGGKFKGQELHYRMTRQTIEVRGIHLSELEAISVSMMWRQEDGRRHMEGMWDEDGNLVSKWSYDQAFVDEVEAKLTPEARAVRDFLTREYEAEYAKLNAIYRRLNGVDLPRHEFYSPITVNPALEKGDPNLDPTTGASVNAGSSLPGALRTRGKMTAEPKFKDALLTFMQHKTQMNHWMASAEFVREFQSLVGHRDVMNTVEASGGEAARKMLGQWLDYFAQGGNRDAAARLEVVGWLADMTSNASAMAIVGRLGVIAVQSTQILTALSEMPTHSYLKRMGMLMAGQLDFRATWNSDYIQRRVKEMPPVVRQLMEGMNSGNPTRVKEAVQGLGRAISRSDAFFTAGTYAIVYDYQLTKLMGDGMARGDAEKMAHLEAERITDRLAQPMRAGTRSMLELRMSTNPAFRMAWNFGSEARKNLGVTLYAMARRGTAQAFRTTMAMLVLNGLMASMIRAAWRDARDADDDEIFDEKNWGVKRMMLSALTEPLHGFPIAGEMIQDAIYAGAGEYRFSGGLLEVMRPVAAMKRQTVDRWTGENDQDMREVMRDVEAILTGMGLVSSNIAAAASLSHLARDLFGVVENVSESAK